MEISKIKFWGLLLSSFIVGWGLSFFIHTKTISIEDRNVSSTHTSSQYTSNASDNHTSIENTNGEIPSYAMETLEYILEHNEAPQGYVGGRTFQNREQRLPKTNEQGQRIKYREWDVHPKIEGQNRGTERLVTSENGDAYFTSDHYNTFIKIK